MRRFLCLVAVVLLVLLPALTSADALSFNETCTFKTSGQTEVYTANADGKLSPSSSIPGGTYLKKLGGNDVTDANPGYTYVCWSLTGDIANRSYGYIQSSAITSAAVSVTLASGKKVTVSEVLKRNPSALEAWLQMEYGEGSDAPATTAPTATPVPTGDDTGKSDEDDLDVEPGEEPIFSEETSSPGLTDAEWYARLAKAAAKNGSYTPTFYTDEEGNTAEVKIVSLGLGRTTVTVGKEKKTVPTMDLLWDTEAPEERILAVVNAPKAGKAALRTTSRSSATIMDYCITNSVVRVIRYGKNWCLVDHQGMRGYIKTASLKFYPKDNGEYTTGVLSYNGRTYSRNGTTTVNIRAKAANGSRILETVVVGEPVTVFSTTGKWSEIDCKGWHGYVLSQYITPDE